MATKLKVLKNEIKEWAKENFRDMRIQKSNILADMQALDRKEELDHLTTAEGMRRLELKEEFHKKAKRGVDKVETKVEMQLVE